MTLKELAPPGSSGGWSQTVTMVAGRSDTSNAFQFSKSCADTWTLQFSLDDIVVSNVVDCVAIVNFILEGNTLSRTISLGQGTSISGRGQGGTVTLRDNSDSAPLGSYRVTISGSSGCRADTGNPPVYDNSDSVGSLAASASSALIPVPPNAGVTSVRVMVTSSSNAPLVSNVNVIGLGFDETTPVIIWSPQVDKGFIPVPAGVQFIEINNTGAASVAIFYSLLWGIDG